MGENGVSPKDDPIDIYHNTRKMLTKKRPTRNRGREAQKWSATIDAGLGIALGVAAHWAVATELHALVASPHPVVRFIDARAATIGYPSMIATLALQVTP